MKNYIDAAAFKEMVLCACDALQENTKLINELNVFPVPDGDTGTNMGLTMANAAAELKKKSFSTIEAVADCTASGLLRGARGNSGVILSLLFRGIAKRLKGLETAGTEEFAGAMKDGVDAAYKAVMKPADGTILSVSRDASNAALNAAELGSDLEGMFMCAIKAGNISLDDTRDINPVLKKAGVVDAGGKGYMVILSAMLDSLRGERVSGSAVSKAEDATEGTPFDVFSTEEITFAYDTVFIVRKIIPDPNLDKYRAYLGSIGDSLVISEDDEIFKVHVHTDTPGDALNEAAKYGILELAKIENMKTQHDELVAGGHVQSTDDIESVEPEQAASEKEYGVVAVCAGKGFEELFTELGADRVVTGGQTMNPSTDDILKEINRTPASTVFVLPNNKNIIMAAEQCQPLTDKKVIVLPTKTVPQGLSAMLNYNTEGMNAEEIAGTMKGGYESVHTAQVTYAARDSDFDGHAIRAGEYLAMLDGKLVGNYSSTKELFKELTWNLDDLSPEFVTIYYGEEITEDDANKMAEALSEVLTNTEISVVFGGQPVYYYVLSIE